MAKETRYFAKAAFFSPKKTKKKKRTADYFEWEGARKHDISHGWRWSSKYNCEMPVRRRATNVYVWGNKHRDTAF